MGFISIVSGYILVKEVEEAAQKISSLPNIENDEYPFLPKDIFLITDKEKIIYKRNYVVHFGMTVKELEGEHEIWIEKFEIFFKSIDSAIEAFVIMHLEPYRSNDFDGKFYYSWKRKYFPKSTEWEWSFEGSERRF